MGNYTPDLPPIKPVFALAIIGIVAICLSVGFVIYVVFSHIRFF